MPKEYRVDGMSQEIDALWQQGIAWLKAAGAEIVDISLPHTKYALPAYYIVAPAEASSNLARYDGVRYGLRVPGKDVIDMYENDPRRGLRQGSAPPHPDRHLCALRRLLRRLLSPGAEGAHADQARLREAWSKVDAMLTPATPSPAFGIRRKVRRSAGDVPRGHLHGDGEHGGPAGHLACRPGCRREGTPLGLQLIGKPFDEATLFRAAQAIEDAAGRFTVPTLVGGPPIPKEGGRQVKMDPKRPWECADMTQVRAEIDRIDATLVDLIAERFGYVDRAWQLKQYTPEGATVPWRIQQVIDKVKARARARPAA